MNKIQKKAAEGKIVAILEKEKIQIGGRVGIDLRASLPGYVEGEGDAKVFFRFPTWLTFDVIRKIDEYIKSKQNSG